jgi:hypothetical protein
VTKTAQLKTAALSACMHTIVKSGTCELRLGHLHLVLLDLGLKNCKISEHLSLSNTSGIVNIKLLRLTTYSLLQLKLGR